MRRVPPSPTHSNGRGYAGRNNTPQMTSSPKAMSVGRSRQNTFTSADDGLAPPLDVTTLDDPDVLFDQLEKSAQNLTTWLKLLQTDLDGILLSAPEPEVNRPTSDAHGLPPVYM